MTRWIKIKKGLTVWRKQAVSPFVLLWDVRTATKRVGVYWTIYTSYTKGKGGDALSRAKRLILHHEQAEKLFPLSSVVNELHVNRIRCQLQAASLNAEQKIQIVDLILAKLHSREMEGRIQ